MKRCMEGAKAFPSMQACKGVSRKMWDQKTYEMHSRERKEDFFITSRLLNGVDSKYESIARDAWCVERHGKERETGESNA